MNNNDLLSDEILEPVDREEMLEIIDTKPDSMKLKEKNPSILKNFLTEKLSIEKSQRCSLRYYYYCEDNEVLPLSVRDKILFFDVEMHFFSKDHFKKAVDNYKFMKERIKRDHILYKNLQNIFEKFDLKKFPTIIFSEDVSKEFNEVYKYDFYVQACQWLENIYFFINEKHQENRRRRNFRHSMLHEFGHYFEQELFKKGTQKEISLSNTFDMKIHKDWMLFNSQFKKVTRGKYREYYNHVTPKNKNKSGIPIKRNGCMNHTQSHELFAELFYVYAENELMIRRKNIVRYDRLNDMFPNTYELIRSLFERKGINKYKKNKSVKTVKYKNLSR